MRQSFGAPIADLGLVLLVITIGSVAVSVAVGALIRRFGVPALLAASGACAALGGTGFALAPGMWLVFAVAVLLGAAAGMMDGGLNTAVGLSGRPRLLNLLHAAYGVGTTVGPLLVTVAIVISSWRPAYAALVALDLVIAASWLAQRRAERARAGAPPSAAAREAPGTPAPERPAPDALTREGPAPGGPVRESPAPGTPVPGTPVPGGLVPGGLVPGGLVPGGLVPGGLAPERPAAGTWHPGDAWSRRRSAFVVAAGMAIFFLYTGVEVAAGQWEASFCRGHLGLSAAAAGIATFGFWGALTGARIMWALLPRPVRPTRIVGWGSAVAVLAAAVIWWQPGVPVTLASFVLLGAALAGVFPALIAMTPDRIGRGRAQHVIAWQVGAAAAGGSGLSALIGLLIGLAGLQILGPSLTVLAILLAGGTVALERVAPIPAP